MTNTARQTVREAMMAGQWYPGTKEALSKMVAGFVSGAETAKVNGRIVSAIAPHAGYVHSGRVAGYTYRAIRDGIGTNQLPETVVVLGFTHRIGFSGVALMDGDAISTPLGMATLDKSASEILMKGRPGIRADYRPHGGEWSAENQIPFIQAVLPDAKLVVALFGDHDPGSIDEMVAGLKALAETRRILVIASSDMLHDADYDLVSRTDRATLRKVAEMDCKWVDGNWRMDRQIFCGVMPVLAAMRYAGSRGCKAGTVLYYRNNGDDDLSARGQWVVGYGSVVFASE